MVHTKDGSRVVRGFLARGTAKLFPLYVCVDADLFLSLQVILKVVKPRIEMCLDGGAQLVLFTALDVIE
jgi:pumilio family protein 6